MATATTTANLISLANEDSGRNVVIQNIENTVTTLEDNAWCDVYILALLHQIKEANAQRTTDIEDRDRQAIEIDEVLLRYRTEGHIDGMTRLDLDGDYGEEGDEGDDEGDDDETVTYGVIEQEIAEDEELSARLEREHRERVREHRERRRQERRQRRNAGISPTAASSAINAVNGDTMSVTGTSVARPGGGEPDASAGGAGSAGDVRDVANPNISGVLSQFDTDMVDTFISLTEEQIEALVDLMTPEQRQRFRTVFASIVEGDIVVDAGTGGVGGIGAAALGGAAAIVSTAVVIDDESDIVDDLNGNYSSDSDSDDDAHSVLSDTSSDSDDSDTDTDDSSVVTASSRNY